LAALPKAWPEGAMRGIRARGAIEADVEWSGGRLRRLTLRGKPGVRVPVRYAGQSRTLELDGKGRAVWRL